MKSISELAERARSYESLAESMTADMRIFRHVITTELAEGSDLADDLLWEMRDSLSDAGRLENLLASIYMIFERAAQRAIAESLDREYLESLGEDLQDRSIHRVRSYRLIG